MLKDYPKVDVIGVEEFCKQVARIRRDDQQEQKRITECALNAQLRSYVVDSATNTFDAAYGVALVDYTSTGAVTINLPPALDMRNRVIRIKDSGGNAGTNNITVDADGSETIDGSTASSISSNYGSLTLLSDGGQWHVL